MGLKGAIKPDPMPVWKYSFTVVGLIPLFFSKIDGIDEELDVIVLPDRTKHPGGNTQPIQFKAMMPAHHTAEIAAMEVWYQEGKDPVTPTAKKVGTLTNFSASGTNKRQISILGCFISHRKTPDLDTSNTSDASFYEWTFEADSVEPI